jgi:hypothetical protein
VATSLSARLNLPTDPAAAYALFTDPAYVEEVAVATGGTDPEVTVTPSDDGGATIVSRRTLPAEVPSYARSLVGETIALTETRMFGPAATDGRRDGTVTVEFAGAPMSVQGALRLEPESGGTVLHVDMSVKASIPFVGGKIEKFGAEQILAFLAKEESVARERLA